LRQSLRPPRAGAPPAWLGDDLRKIWPGHRDEWDDLGYPWRSWVQHNTWRALATVTTAIPSDYRQHYGAEVGVELRLPFLDRRLVTFVLAIPYAHRLPGGYMRRIQWKALEDRIPREVFSKARVTSAESARIREGENGISRYREIFESREWSSGAFVSQRLATKLLDRAVSYRSATRAARIEASTHWQTVQRIATLETWLRTVFRYSLPQED
jgi:asparagine synthetase B (glutamine-hydrolysing)